MPYLTEEQLSQMGFRFLGTNVRISDKAAIYNAEQVEIGDYSRIDDFCIISGRVVIGRYCHITPM
jgi:UDP-3-O-[3-hydroxymyristoyl] glucosamine N-acyltransferase